MNAIDTPRLNIHIYFDEVKKNLCYRLDMKVNGQNYTDVGDVKKGITTLKEASEDVFTEALILIKRRQESETVKI